MKPRSAVLIARRRPAALGSMAAAALLAGGLLAASPVTAMHAAAVASDQPCPGAESLVRATTWVTHRLAPGVTLQEGVHDDRTVWGTKGAVDMHVLRIDLSRPSISTAPLVDHLAERQPLSVLADNRRHLVAATNTGFFDFYSGTPGGPVLRGGKPLLLSAVHQPVIGFTAAGVAVPESVWLVGSVHAGGHTYPLQALNALHPRRGLSVYTPVWGQITNVPRLDGRRTVFRMVRHGAISGAASSRPRVGPASGELLVASTPGTQNWLRRLPDGTKVTTQMKVASSSRPLVQGYSVGKQLVRAGRPAGSLGCNERDTQAARTGIGVADNGKTLIIAVVEDHPCWERSRGCGKRQVHGLDHKEMARLMADLGARQAWQWDGSGSSELIARMPSTHKLSIRNYCADGEERPMPVGFGIFSKPRR